MLLLALAFGIIVAIMADMASFGSVVLGLVLVIAGVVVMIVAVKKYKDKDKEAKVKKRIVLAMTALIVSGLIIFGFSIAAGIVAIKFTVIMVDAWKDIFEEMGLDEVDWSKFFKGMYDFFEESYN